jgi:hypothetical protein
MRTDQPKPAPSRRFSLPASFLHSPVRVALDGDEVVLVYENHEPDLPRCLVFESSGKTQDLLKFPDDWRRMPESALLALRKRPTPTRA